VGELNDVVFVEASAVLSQLGKGIPAAASPDAATNEFAFRLLEALKGSEISLEDVSGSDVVSLEISAPKTPVKARRGDIVAIPGLSSNRHLGVVLTQNRFGTAIGLLHSSSLLPRLRKASRCPAYPRPVYTDDRSIADGEWPIIDHAEDWVRSFSDEPEIYHAPNRLWPGDHVGQFGSAESPTGGMREITREEGEEVGLASGTYRQVYVSQHLQQLLDGEA
jgi:hypothetical protein